MTEPRWRRLPDAAWTGDERRIVAARTSPPDPEGPRILEGAAAWVWLALDGPVTSDEVAARIAADGDPATAADDVRRALADLESAGLVNRG
jgi:hypothetical protein